MLYASRVCPAPFKKLVANVWVPDSKSMAS